ncbi:MAG: putative peroxidase-related enzyme [Cellvibrionaceae bacterium]
MVLLKVGSFVENCCVANFPISIFHPYSFKTMSWIKIIQESEATGRLKELYEKYVDPAGFVDNILKIHSLNPKSLKTHFDLYSHAMRGRSDLSKAQREMIAVTVSAINHCEY